MSDEDRRVLIAGGGPVGLLSAWRLGSRGISVRLFDDNESLQPDPRAATTHPATLDLLAEGRSCGRHGARRAGGAHLSVLGSAKPREGRRVRSRIVLKDDTSHPFVVQCEQFKTAKLILDRLRKLSNVDVLFSHEVVEVAQTNGLVSVDVRGPRRSDRGIPALI